jgi:hypothetical protein
MEQNMTTDTNARFGESETLDAYLEDVLADLECPNWHSGELEASLQEEWDDALATFVLDVEPYPWDNSDCPF